MCDDFLYLRFAYYCSDKCRKIRVEEKYLRWPAFIFCSYAPDESSNFTNCHYVDISVFTYQTRVDVLTVFYLRLALHIILGLYNQIC